MFGRGLTPGTRVAPPPGLQAMLGSGYLLAVAGLTALVESAGGVRPMFDPTPGLAFGYLVLVGIRGVPVALVADLLAHLIRSGPGADALVPVPWQVPDHVARVLLVAGCAVLLRRRWNERAPIITLAWFVLTGLLVAPIGTATAAQLVTLAAGADMSAQRWATLVMSAAAGTATLAPAVMLPVRALLGAATVPIRIPLRTRLETVVQALLLIITPVVAVVATSVSRNELPSLALALVPLAWVGLRPDLVRTPVVLAASGLALAITITATSADLQTLFRAQSLMLTSGMATLFVGATLAADWATRRDAELAAGRWQALVDLAPVVVARVGPEGRWRTDPGGRDTADGGRDGAEETVAAARRVPEVRAALEQHRAAAVHWHSGASGRQRHFLTQLTPLADNEMLTVTTETTRVQSAEAALAWERTHDRDTGLPNRDLLLATAGRAVAETVSSSLAVLDVGDLSQRAALVGLEPGAALDALSSQVDDALAAAAEPGDQVLLARVGDDQLGVLLPLPAPLAADRVERVVAALGGSLAVAGHRLPVLVGSGVASLEADLDPRESLRRAVTAGQASRETGRGEVVIFDRLSTASVAERARLAGEVVAAVEGGELEVLFQPDVDLPSGRLSGVEALVRWRRRAGYLAATDLFVQVAEESGAVRQVDAWVLEESLAQLGRWRSTGTAAADALELGVNVSALSLTRELPARLKAACDRHRVPPSRVRLEVTETALGDDGDAAWVLREVRGLGFRVALDDFGTGYASLSRLSRLPVDLLKLDRSFLHTLTEDTASRALVSLVLGLADPLSVEVLVEGVETDAQRDLLVELGCRRAQGFLFSRPASAAAIQSMLLADGPVTGPATGPIPLPVLGRANGQANGAANGAANAEANGRADGQAGSRPASTASATAAPSAAPATIALDQVTSHAPTASGSPEA